MSRLLWCLFPEHTCKHVEKKNVATRWQTTCRTSNTCLHQWGPLTAATAAYFHDTHLKKPKNYKSCMKGWVAHLPAPCGWIRMKGCLKYVHILGCFSVWFLCLSSAKKRSWGKKKFLEECAWFGLHAYPTSYHVSLFPVQSKTTSADN